GGREVLAGVAAAVGLVAGALPTQAQSAERVLVAAAAGLEAARLLVAPARGEGRAGDVGGAGPDAAPAGTRGADVVVHLPAWSQAVALVGPADRLDDLAPHGVAEIGQAVERLQRARHCAEAPGDLGGGARQIGGCRR